MAGTGASLTPSPTLNALAGLVTRNPKLWIRLGNAETKLLAPDLESIRIEKPVYIAGLARSGSTMLLEILATAPGVATHRYQDFPFLFTPHWWNTLLKLQPVRNKTRRERAHGDGIIITPESPEAMEEMLWTAFFPGLHDGNASNVLDASTLNAPFAGFYRDHIKKLLLVRKASRYAAKGNYNLTRLAYLQALFPDAKFVIPVRDPVTHIGSLMRQHQRFSAAGKTNPAIAAQLAASGHFEFGPGRMPVHTGNDLRMREIREAWRNGEEIRGWALYWDALHSFIDTQLAGNPILKSRCTIIRFEDLCAAPAATIRALLAHCDLPEADSVARWEKNLHAPDYYESGLTASDTALIHEITGDTAKRFGY